MFISAYCANHLTTETAFGYLYQSGIEKPWRARAMSAVNGTIQKPSDAALKALTQRAMEDIASGAIEYLRKQGKLDLAKADRYAGLSAEMTKLAKAAILKAYDDARDAFEAGMEQTGAATFASSMILAGIEAAKNWLAKIGK